MKNIFFLILFLFFLTDGYGQPSCNPSPGAKANFKILDSNSDSITKICLGYKITLLDLSNSNCIVNYLVDEVNNPSVIVPSDINTGKAYYKYNKPGKYRIAQVVPIGATGDSTGKSLQVLGNPTFSVSFCSNFKVDLQINDSGYDNYTVDFGDSSPPITYPSGNVSHIYINNSQAKIVVTGNLKSCNPSTSKTITPIQNITIPLWIDVNRSNLTTDIIRLDSIKNYLSYNIYQTNLNTHVTKNIKSFVDTNQNTIVLKVSNLDSNSVYQYFIKSNTSCYQDSSIKIQTLPFNAQSATNNITLKWKVYTGNDFVKYQIFKNGNLLSESVNQLQSYFIDNNIICHRNYCYQLITVLKNNISSYSYPSCAIGLTNYSPVAINNITATIENGKPILSWPAPLSTTIKNYSIFLNNLLIAVTLQPSYKESNPYNSSICYKVIYKDSCDNQSESNDVCPVYLSKENLQLIWTEYKGWDSGIKNYTLEIIDENNSLVKTLYSGLNLNFSLPEFDKSQQIFRFRIKTTGISSGLISYSNIFIWQQDSKLAVPTAFTPNGDNLNPDFRANGIFIQTFNMTIYNRWGQVIFASDDIYKGWDGNIQNQPAPVDSYVYNINAVDFSGKSIKRSGTFALIR